MKKFKFIPMILAVTMTAGLFVGCGKKEEVAKPSKPDVEQESGETAVDPIDDPKDIVDLKWYTFTAQPQDDLEAVNAAINEYTAEKIGVTVDMVMIPGGDYNDKMLALINSGGDFDICFSAGWTNNYIVNAKKGAFLAIDNLLETEGKEMYDAINPLFWESAKVDGEIFGVPAQKEIEPSAGVILPTKFIEKYNIDTSKIKSIYDMEDYLKLIKENEPGVTPWYMEHHMGVDFDFHKLVDGKLPVGVEIKSDGTTDYKVVNIRDTDTMKDIYAVLNKYYNAGYINADAATLPGATVADIKGKEFGAFLVETGPAQDGYFSDAVGQDVEYVQLWSGIAKGNPPAIQAVSAQSDHPEEAIKFLNLLNTDPELRNLVSYGIEGTHYEKVSGNVIKRLPAMDKWTVPHYTFGNLLITNTLDTEAEDKWEQFLDFNDKIIKSPVFGMKAATEGLENEIAAVTNAQEEFMNILSTGSVDSEQYVAQMNEKLKGAGIDKIIEAVQTELDEWLANNQ